MGGGGGDGDVAHFAAGFDALFAVQVQVHVGQGQHLLPGRGARLACGIKPDIAQQVEQNGRAVVARRNQRQAHGGAHLQIELAVGAGIDGVVAAVVRARRHFVHDPAAVLQDEVFHAQHAHVVQPVGDAGGGLHQLFGQVAGHGARKRVGGGKNAAVVHIALRLEVHHVAVCVARHDDGAFQRQRQFLFDHAGHAAQLQPGIVRLLGIGHRGLAFAVVAHAGGFDDGGKQLGRQRQGVGRVVQRAVGRAGHLAVVEMLFFVQAVLCLGHGWRGRRHGGVLRQIVQRGGGHVFKFGGDAIAGMQQLLPAVGIVVSGHDVALRGLAGGAVGVGVEYHGAIAHALRGVYQHAPQLPTAQHAQRGRRQLGRRSRGAGMHGKSLSGKGRHGQ